MTAPEPRIVWEKSDRLLSGSMLAIRAVGLPEAGELRAAVAITVHLDRGSVHVAPDGSATATLLVDPEEALGVVAWLREASAAAQEIGPPLFGWESDAPD